MDPHARPTLTDATRMLARLRSRASAASSALVVTLVTNANMLMIRISSAALHQMESTCAGAVAMASLTAPDYPSPLMHTNHTERGA